MPRKGGHLTAGKGHDMFGENRKFVYGCGAHTSTRSYEDCQFSITMGRAKEITGATRILLSCYHSAEACHAPLLALHVMPLIGGTNTPQKCGAQLAL